MKVHNKKSLLEIRRKLRQKSTPAEDCLWQQLRNGKTNDLKCKRQHSIGNYIVDFYCASKRLIIEVDGGIHNTLSQSEKDKLRDENLIDMGFKVMRFKNEEVLFSIDDVLKEIVAYSNTKTSS
ncbi:MAG: hypothetical protein A3F72_20560 [Bacteroidetes bacterium RIFCSPLOWO2_12_FULL_35_15]|nr:MAG: hypothetical protein A3F72_20560 [Bacteroidetes bacterium RIFCSPLOWO2_12_FULL_35_15]